MGSDGNVQFSCISIHALREEGDGGVAAVFRSFACISIHALREEGDDKRVCKGVILIISIHALREEGDLIAPTKIDLQAISIHALREEGDLRTDAPDVIANISIHALREEGDYNTEAIKLLLKEFLSTPSARRATLAQGLLSRLGQIFLSTPSARRATLHPGISPCCTPKFLSTPSARRATGLFDGFFPRWEFLSTPSARRATVYLVVVNVVRVISIHALREEGDAIVELERFLHINFYPRPPRGGRLFLDEFDHIIKEFLSTPSARRATNVV